MKLPHTRKIFKQMESEKIYKKPAQNINQRIEIFLNEIMNIYYWIILYIYKYLLCKTYFATFEKPLYDILGSLKYPAS